jgi:TolA-binding protein
MIKKLFLQLCLLSLLLSSCSGAQTITEKTAAGSNPSGTLAPTATPTPLPKTRITLGESDLLNGDFDAALNEFWTARSQSTDPEIISVAQLGVGRVLLLKKDYRGAIDQLSWLISNFESGEARNTAYFFLAQAYQGLDQSLLAAEAFGNYVANQPGPLDSEILVMQGDALTNGGNYAEAKNQFRSKLLSL